MAELALQDRLQPALLDRLADDEPDKKTEPRENRVVTKNKLRQGVLRDLGWLLNAINLGRSADFAGMPHAERSVINFGLPAFSGQSVSALDTVQLENLIRQAIIHYEPRIAPVSLQVEALITESQLDHHNLISVHIRGDLWAQPIPIELLLRTEIDLETGQVKISDLVHADLNQEKR